MSPRLPGAYRLLIKQVIIKLKFCEGNGQYVLREKSRKYLFTRVRIISGGFIQLGVTEIQ